jgi:hypothetical protein
MKKLIIFITAIFLTHIGFSQYSAGTIKVGLVLGNSPYVSLLSAPNQTSSQQNLNPTGADWISGTYNPMFNMIGLEGKFFIADGLAGKFIGGGQYSMTPGQSEIPGTDYTGNFNPNTDLPKFTEVPEQKYYQYLFQLGADYYLTKNNVALYGGGIMGFRYGGASRTYQFINNGIQDVSSEVAAGASNVEVYGYQFALNFGAEYGTQEGLFAGVEIRPISLAYTVSTIQPIAGVNQSGDNLNWGFFVFPTLRFGVNF